MVPKGHKQCTKCGEVKVFAEFYSKKGGRFGLRADCIKCFLARSQSIRAESGGVWQAYMKAWRETNKEKVSAQKRAWRETNREEVSAQKRAWYATNREKVLAQKKASRIRSRNSGKLPSQKHREYLAHKDAYSVRAKTRYAEKGEMIRAKVTVYREKNIEKVRARVKAYLASPSGRVVSKALRHKRRQRAQFAFDRSVTKADLLHWEEHGAICYLTGEFLPPGKITWDHVVPLHWGGTHDVWNIAPASYFSNSRKLNRIVYFDLATREARYTLDPCPGGLTWPRIKMVVPSLDEMQAMVGTWKARRAVREAA